MIPYAIDNQAPERRGLVLSLIAAIAAAFVLQILAHPASDAFMFTPAERAPVTWITSQFMHAGLIHLAGNMYVLYLFAPAVAYRLGLWFMPFYLACGIAANLLHAAVDPFSHVPCLGASGAVAGVMGAFVVLFPKSRLKFWGRAGPAFQTYVLSPLLFSIVWVLAEGMGAFDGSRGVAHWAHLGGFIFGLGAATAMPGEKTSGTTREIVSRKAKAVLAALAKGDDWAACEAYVEAAGELADFQLASDADQLAAAKALYRSGGSHLCEAALRRLADRSPDSAEGAEAILLLGDLELTRFKEFAAAAERYRAAAAHPRLPEGLRAAAATGSARAASALAADDPLRAEGFCDVLFEGEPPLTPAQLEVARRVLNTSPGPMDGVLARALAAPAALAATRALEEAGLPAVVFPDKARLRLGPGGVAEDVKFAGDGIYAHDRLMLSYEDVLLAAAVWVVEKVREHGVFDVGLDDHLDRGSVEVRRHSPRLELVARDGRRLRYDPPEESLDLLRRALARLSLRSRRVHLDWGARAVLGGREPLWAFFDDAERSDVYLDWQLRLACIKDRPEYGR